VDPVPGREVIRGAVHHPAYQMTRSVSMFVLREEKIPASLALFDFDSDRKREDGQGRKRYRAATQGRVRGDGAEGLSD